MSLPHSRPMPTIGTRCHELRIPDEDRTWRIVHAIEPDAIVVLEVFSKKTSATPTYVIKAAKNRLKVYRSF